MLTTIIIIFVIGYLCIALEHPLKIDKTASALLLGMLLWILYAFGAETLVPAAAGEHFQKYLAENPELAGESVGHQALQYILNVDVIEHLGDITQTLLFLIGAMTIVELVDVHGGFRIITDRITTRNKRSLLWIIAFCTFFMSAILDNLTTTIVMVMLLRKLVQDQHERWLYAASIVIAANSGGAWSPIGDVTTIMLWVKGNVTALALIKYVLLPSIVSMVLPIFVVSLKLNGQLAPIAAGPEVSSRFSARDR
ncbi:MAG: sodium:proton antiporter NhaD, partial [Duncaniella sp.]|nr:sodium:proton antiporter NhaD [Duncaniella sp.]